MATLLLHCAAGQWVGHPWTSVEAGDIELALTSSALIEWIISQRSNNYLPKSHITKLLNYGIVWKHYYMHS